jgi:hypothetical protein
MSARLGRYTHDFYIWRKTSFSVNCLQASLSFSWVFCSRLCWNARSHTVCFQHSLFTLIMDGGCQASSDPSRLLCMPHHSNLSHSFLSPSSRPTHTCISVYYVTRASGHAHHIQTSTCYLLILFVDDREETLSLCTVHSKLN